MVKKWICLGAIIIILMTVLFYIPAIHGGYIWDDNSYVVSNPTLRTLGGLRRIWLEIGAVPQYYPLVYTSFWIEYHLWQLNPFGYHMVNVVLHALNAILLWIILQRLSIAGAWMAAAVFAIHPVHVESVAWITERKNVLSCFFYLSAVLVYLRFLKWDRDIYSTSSPSTKHTAAEVAIKYRWRYYAFALGLYLCALLSKTVTSTMPFAILLLLWWKRGRIRLHSLLLLIPYFVMGAALGLTTIWMEKHRVGAQGEEWSFSLVERCLIAGRALWFYIGKLFWPYNLTFIYPRWHIDASVWWQYLYPLTVVVVLLVLWIFRKQIGKGPLISVLFFGGTLAPALGFFDVYPMQFSFVADHFQYLASIGLIVLGITFSRTILQRTNSVCRTIACVAYGIVILMFGMLVWQRGHIYKDVEALWRDTIAKNPTAWIAYNNLGNVLSKQDKLEEAIKYYKKAIAIRPNFAKAHFNLAGTYFRQGMLDDAIAEYKKALSIDPKFAEIHNNIGQIYYQIGMLDDAIAEYKKALSINPRLAMAHYNLSVAYYYKENYNLAVAHCTKALELGLRVVDPKFLELLAPYR